MSQGPLEYEPKDGSRRESRRKFWIGFGIGFGAPVVSCTLGVIAGSSLLIVSSLALAAGALLAGVLILADRQYRMVGLGLVSSFFFVLIALGGICALGMR